MNLKRKKNSGQSYLPNWESLLGQGLARGAEIKNRERFLGKKKGINQLESFQSKGSVKNIRKQLYDRRSHESEASKTGERSQNPNLGRDSEA